MADQKTLIRIMGESDIVDVTMTRKAASHTLLMGLDAADKVTFLGIVWIRIAELNWRLIKIILTR